MPGIVIDVEGGTDRAAVIGSQLLDDAHIFHASVQILRGSTTSGRTHVQVGVFHTKPLLENLVGMLLEDYVYGAHVPSFHGRFPTEPGDGIMMIVRSADGVTCRLTTRSQKWDP